MSELPYTYSIVIGDWSGDGHEKCEHFIFMASHPKDEIIKAYKKAVLACGVSLHEENMKKQVGMPILCEYEDSHIEKEEMDKLRAIGCKFEWANSEEYGYGKLHCCPGDVFNLFMEMVSTQIPDFKWEQQKRPESINGYWDKNFNVGFGYGVFN